MKHFCLFFVHGSFCSNWNQSVSIASLTSSAEKLITLSVKVEGCSCRLLHLLHSFLWTVSETIQLDCVCTCSVLFSHLTGHPGTTVCWFQGNLAILLFISEVRVTPLSLVLYHCGSLLWRWCSTCSRKLSFSLSQRCCGCRRNGRWCSQDVWRPFWTFIFVTVGKCRHSSRHGWSSRGHTLERK